MPQTAGIRLEPIDYDLHGVVGIRLLGATRGDARAVARQLGPLGQTLKREPDIVIRFVDDLCPTSPLHYLGVDDAACTHDAFLVLQNLLDPPLEIGARHGRNTGERQLEGELTGFEDALRVDLRLAA